ncbi:MAG: hypothetical protein HY862_07425 [Chloroflexi bacterium]|nr:hypothetical protein [Chloroflexota bacterium]
MIVIVLHLIFIALIFGLPFTLIQILHRRYKVGYPLLVVGGMTFSLSLFIRTALLWVLQNGPFLNSPLIGSTIIGLVISFTDIGARAFGYARLARSTVYRPQAMLIGIGHALPELSFVGLWVIWVVLGLAKQGAAPVDLSEVGGNAFGEMISTLAPLGLHITLSWMVLQTFLRNEASWIFQAILWCAMVIGTEELLVRGSTQPEILTGLWWGLVTVINLVIFWRIKPPFVWETPSEDQGSTVT